MATNWGAMEAAIKRKAEAVVRDKVDAAMLGMGYLPGVPSLAEAGQKMADTVNAEIHSSGLSAGQQGAINEFQCGAPSKIGNFRYCITVLNAPHPSPSLVPERYGYIEDLTLLFNDGVDHVMKPVRGYWHGEEIWSRTSFPTTHFLENARDNFIANYGSTYHIMECKLNR